MTSETNFDDAGRRRHSLAYRRVLAHLEPDPPALLLLQEELRDPEVLGGMVDELAGMVARAMVAIHLGDREAAARHVRLALLVWAGVE